MAAITFEITFGEGDEPKQFTIDPDDLPLGFNEDLESAVETGKWRDLNRVFAEFLGLTHAEMRKVTNRQFKQMMTAIADSAKEVVASPNGSSRSAS